MGSDTESEYDIVVIGSGIAGMSAAIYTARAGRTTLVVHGDEPGGQLTLTSDVANYPGFPDAVGGPELVSRMREQAEQFGANFEYGQVDSISQTNTADFGITFTDDTCITASSVIAASGASARTLGVPGESELMGYGVSTCATCDGAFFRGEDMLVVGGGDAALEEASFLTKFADTVHLVHRRDEFRAEQSLVDTISQHVSDGDVELVLNSEVTSIQGSEEDGIESVSIVTSPDGYPTSKMQAEGTVQSEMSVGAVFVSIGHIPNTEFLSGINVETDPAGYLETDPSKYRVTETHVPGFFGAGDVVDDRYQQAATASGMGVKAALDADEYLSEQD